ncbi:hypothetical protein AMECASPLE_011923 [Ameca splendens]|uniref:Uncharacterized protein n=1 Tax=Ameca splendens TaxID=208324 RepID=A0ABV0ZAS2_9TELE
MIFFDIFIFLHFCIVVFIVPFELFIVSKFIQFYLMFLSPQWPTSKVKNFGSSTNVSTMHIGLFFYLTSASLSNFAGHQLLVQILTDGDLLLTLGTDHSLLALFYSPNDGAAVRTLASQQQNGSLL